MMVFLDQQNYYFHYLTVRLTKGIILNWHDTTENNLMWFAGSSEAIKMKEGFYQGRSYKSKQISRSEERN